MYQPNSETLTSLARLMRGCAWRDAENVMRALHLQGFGLPMSQSFGGHVEKKSLREQFVLLLQPESNAGAVASFQRSPMGSYDGMGLTWMLSEPMSEGMIGHEIRKSISKFTDVLGPPFGILDTSAQWSDASAPEFSLIASLNWPKSVQANVKKTTISDSSESYLKSLHKKQELVHIGVYATRTGDKLFALTAIFRA